MEKILIRNPDILREWIQFSSEPASSPNRFRFGPLQNKLKVVRMLKQADARRKRRAQKRAQKIVLGDLRSCLFSFLKKKRLLWFERTCSFFLREKK